MEDDLTRGFLRLLNLLLVLAAELAHALSADVLEVGARVEFPQAYLKPIL